MKTSIHISLVVFLISFIGCDSAYYKKSFSFQKKQWLYDDARTFTFEIGDTTQVYDMVLTVKHTDAFPYQNLYLNTSTTFPSDTVTSQLLSLEMANDAGFWFGECSGSNCELSIPIQSGVHFPELGEYQLELLQHTRTDTLGGVCSIGLKLVEVKE